MRYYTTITNTTTTTRGNSPRRPDQLLTLAPSHPADRQRWIINRLRVLRRLLTLNNILSETVQHFDRISIKTLPRTASGSPDPAAEIKPLFDPRWDTSSGGSRGRAWHYLRRRDSWTYLDEERVDEMEAGLSNPGGEDSPRWRAWEWERQVSVVRDEWFSESTWGFAWRDLKTVVKRAVRGGDGAGGQWMGPARK